MADAQMTLQDPDALYQSFDKNLYRIQGTADDDAIMAMMQADQSVNNSANVTVSASDFGSGVDTSTTIQTTGSMQAGKKTYDNTVSGYILGVDPSVGIAKFYIGNTTSYMNWDGSTLTIKGSISASSIDIPDTVTANSFHVDSSGNTWWGATTLASAPAAVTAAGVGTFIGLSSLNKKAYTNFESSGRFISSVGGTGSNTFGNQGVTVAPGATATSYARLLWDIADVLTNNPTFTATVNVLSVNSGDARSFIGMGLPTIDGTGINYNNKNMIGFTFNKTSGVLTLASQMNDGGNGTSVGTNMITLSAGDIIELFIRVTATSVKWYYRKSGGAITLGDTQTTHIPTTNAEQYLVFAVSNIGTANDMQLIMQCAAYEH